MIECFILLFSIIVQNFIQINFIQNFTGPKHFARETAKIDKRKLELEEVIIGIAFIELARSNIFR